MASGPAEICNMALSALGQSIEIASITENSPEARACNRFYEKALKRTLRDFQWPFATKFAALALDEEDPTTEWAYAYDLPSDCVQPRRILSGIRNDNRQSKIPFRIVGEQIYTDMVDAELEYTRYVDNANLFDEDFKEALALRLAFLIAPRILGGDPQRIGELAYKKYLFAISEATANARNEEQPEEPPEAESIRGRD